MPLIPVEPLTKTYSRYVGRYKGLYPYEYTIEYNWLPSYNTMRKYIRRYFPQFNVKGDIKLKKISSSRYSFQYIPRDKPPRCKLIIDSKAKKFYVEREELIRLMRDYNLRDINQAYRMCQNQAVIILSLLQYTTKKQQEELMEKLKTTKRKSIIKLNLEKIKSRVFTKRSEKIKLPTLEEQLI